MDIFYALIGLVLLLFAGDALVRGAVALGLRLGIPVLIVGLTVVAFGTSAPELLVTVQAVLEGVPGIALGNVVGSNIANVLLVLGLPALIGTIDASNSKAARSFWMMIAASLVLIGLAFAGPLHFWHAAVLLTLFALLMIDMVRQGRNSVPDEVTSADPAMPGWKLGAYLVAGLVGLPLGAQFLIDGAVGLAQSLGVPEEVIGLTMVAIGTSLPELATTFVAARRGETDVAMGNVIGSNLFNILSILGIASLFGPIPVERAFLTRDLWVMLGAALVLAPFVLIGWKITRLWGIVFILAYAGYGFLLFRAGGGA
jgi:cation:H+ antiporter